MSAYRYKTKHQVLEELQSQVERSGKPVVYYQTNSGRFFPFVRVKSSNSGKMILATSGETYLISSLFKAKLPKAMTRDNAISILEALPQLPLHFETHTNINGVDVVVNDFSFLTSTRDKIHVKVNRRKFAVIVSSLRTVLLPPPTDETTEGHNHDACEHKDRSSDEVSVQLLAALNEHREFVWWKTREGYNTCGHVLAKSQRTCLVKTSSNAFHLINADSLSVLFPPDVRQQEIADFIQNLPSLLSNFNIQVYLASRITKVWDEWRTVSKIAALGTSTFTVVDDKNKRHQYVTLDRLRAVPVGGATAIANDAAKDVAKLNTKLQTVSAELQQKTAQLTNERAEKERTMDELAARERELKDALRKTKTTAQQLRQEKSSSATKSDDINRLTRSLSEKKRELSRKTGDLKRERDQSARKSTDLARKNSEISELKRQVKQLERNVSAREETIAEYGNRFSEMKREQGELRLEVTNKNAEIKQLNKNIDAYEGVEEELTEVRKKNKELYREKAALRSQLGDYNDEFALDNPINSINFVSKLENLRDQEHAFACDVLIEEMGWDVKDAYHLLFEVFMFSYEYFENRMNNIRSLLNMDGDSALSALFSGRLQSNYAKLLDKKGLEERFVVEFEEKLGHNVEHRDMKKYLGACGELCWVAVLRTVPAQVYFYPRSNEINADELELFDSSRFVDYDQLNGERFVVQYILPGVSRVDSDRPLGLPLVLTEGRDDEKSDSNEEEAGLPVDEMRSELAPIEDAMWQSKRRRTRKLFGQMKIDPENCDLVIGCAVDGCDFIHASSFAEFLSTIDRHRLCCREDEDHIGVKILKLVPHEE